MTGKVGRPRKIPVATAPVFEHLEEEFGRQVISAQTCGSYPDLAPTARWYCLRTHHNADYVALVDLARIGFVVHCGLFVERTKRNPSRSTDLPKDTPVIRRLFPGHVFVVLDFHDPRWPLVKTGRGVNRLLTRDDGRPIPVPSGEMFRLLLRAGPQGYEDKVSKAPREPAGKQARFVNLTSMSEAERLMLLQDVMRSRFDLGAAAERAA